MKTIALKVVTLPLLIIFFFGILPINTLAIGAPGSEYGYDTNWKYWSQGGTQFTTDSAGPRKKMYNAGCQVVSLSKLIMESGFAPANFNPDVFLEYLIENGFVSGDSIGMDNLTAGRAVSSYTNGELIFVDSQPLSGTAEDKAQAIQEKINQQYFVILVAPDPAHYTYVLRNESKETPWISRTQHDAYNSKHYPWSTNKFVQSFLDWDTSFSTAVKSMYYFRLKTSLEPNTLWKSSVNFQKTTTSSDITSSSVKLKVKISFSGTIAQEVGIDIGTSRDNMTYLTHDLNPGSWTNPQSFMYDLSAKGYALTPGQTYWYQFYAKSEAGTTDPNKVAHSDPFSFTVPNDTSTFSVTFSNTTNSSEIKGTTAIVRTQISYNGAAPKEVGFDFGTSPGNLSYKSCDKLASGYKNGQAFHYDLSRYVGKLQPNTTYYYWFYAKKEIGSTVSDQVVHSPVYSFTTASSDSAGSGSVCFSNCTVSNVTSYSARPSMPYTYSGNVPSELGIYYGTDPSDLVAWPESAAPTRGGTVSFNISGLSSGTTYYFQTYAIQDGVEVRSSAGSFKTEGSSSVSFENVKVSSVTTTNAVISGKINYPVGNLPSYAGVQIGTSPSSMTMVIEDYTGSLNSSYGYLLITDSANKYGYTLSPGTTYYYRVYARYGSSYYYDSVRSFTTVSDSPGVSFQDVSCASITTTNVLIKARVNHPTGNIPSHVGVQLGTSSSSLTMIMEDCTESLDPTYGYILLTYSANKYGYTLSPGTTYYYRVYARYGSTYVYDTIRSFTTSNDYPNVTFQDVYVTDTTSSNAVIKAQINHPIGNLPTHAGVQIGTSASSLTMVIEDYTGSLDPKYGYIRITDSANKYGCVLNPGTTYYYRVYARYGSTYIYDSIKSFTTSSTTPSVSFQDVTYSDLTTTNVILKARINHPVGNLPTHAGVQIGTSASTLTMVIEDYTGSLDPSYGFIRLNDPANKYGFTLNPGTTYYYRFFARYGSSYIYDSVYQFTTPGSHAHSYTTESRNPTCTENGYTIYTCSACGYSYTVESSKTGHSWGEWEVWSNPTCESAGTMARVCKNDPSHIETKEIDALGHQWGEWEVWAYPTCESSGTMVRICANDPDHVETIETVALGHQWGEWEVSIPATCVSDGVETRQCLNDIGHIETRSIPAQGHNDVPDETFPTCTEEGYTTYRCSVCGDSYIDKYSYVPALGHDFGEWVVTKEATLTEEGIETRTCTREGCGVTETRAIPKLDPQPNPSDAKLVISNVRAMPGKTVTVEVSVENNPGFASFIATVNYDTSRLTLVSAALADGIGGQFNYARNVAWINGSDYAEDGVFLILTFMVKDDADEGDAFISLTYAEGDISNHDEDDVNFSVVDGSVHVFTYIPGDINGDGVVNSKDLTRLLKYVSGENVTVNEAALDVNGDGKVNSKDLTRLLKYLSGEDVQIF